MKAAYWTGIGVLLIPIGVLLAVVVPSLNQLAFWLVIGGIASLIAGWVYTIRDERDKKLEMERAEERRQKEYRQRDREHEEYLVVLGEIARRLGVSIPLLNLKLKRRAEKRRAKKELEDDL